MDGWPRQKRVGFFLFFLWTLIVPHLDGLSLEIIIKFKKRPEIEAAGWMDSRCPRRSHHRGGSVFFFFGHLMAGDIDKVTSQPLRLYILYVSYLVTPLVFLNSRGERREISSGY